MLTMCRVRSNRSFSQSLRYIIPKRLTLGCNPKIIAWLFWNFYEVRDIDERADR